MNSDKPEPMASDKHASAPANAAGDFLRAAALTALVEPYESVRQIANQFGASMPEWNPVGQLSKPTGTLDSVAQSLGSAIGMVPEVLLTSKLVHSAFKTAGLTAETIPVTGSLSNGALRTMELGTTGAAYGAVFQPAEDSSRLGLSKLQNAAIGAGTFATFGAVSSSLGPLKGILTSEVPAGLNAGRIAINAGTSGIAGAFAGGANSLLNKEVANRSTDLGANMLQYGVLGLALGGAVRSDSISGEKMNISRKVEMHAPNPEKGVLGQTPESYEPQLRQIEQRYGANSAEAASAYMQMGDAAMLQGTSQAPHAMAYYERALNVHESIDPRSLETAWSYDKLAAVKHTTRDYAGASSDLSNAINIWKQHAAQGDPAIDHNYLVRREEDLQLLSRMVGHQQ